jgi:hypothetical protein
MMMLQRLLLMPDLRQDSDTSALRLTIKNIRPADERQNPEALTDACCDNCSRPVHGKLRCAQGLRAETTLCKSRGHRGWAVSLTTCRKYIERVSKRVCWSHVRYKSRKYIEYVYTTINVPNGCVGHTGASVTFAKTPLNYPFSNNASLIVLFRRVKRK